MAVPRNRSSNSRKKTRRSHMAKKKINTCKCSNCQSPVLSHRICSSCGFYNKKPVVIQETPNAEE